MNFSQICPLISNYGSKGKTGNNLTAFRETDPTTLKEKKAIKIQRLSLAKAIKRSLLDPILAPAIQFF